MDKTTINRNESPTVTNQPQKEASTQNDILVKIRALKTNKPNLVQHLTRSNPIQVSSGLKILQTQIQSNGDPSYQPLVTISDDDNSDEDDFVSPIHKLTKDELREELKTFRHNDDSTRNSSSNALLSNANDDDDDDDAGEIEFRTCESKKRSGCCYQIPYSVQQTFCKIS